ncbi:hypothetical protein EX30DRAFT_339864 [Ascodesmis nigricans]|uniref:NOT2/NOT3/NOT5 C-terminal domain-containing protein n=1 Tax=Ascodesmis nigricans TaxID=341454 RepID=A0A4V3SJ46_9PEZI|nr:hypothetical protein EX30DRAFT_339864 [Ascodesmis nigricans]
MNRQGPANQQLRMGFPSVGAAAGRSAMSNGKLASPGGWPPVPPPGVPTPGSRPGLTFSQSVGGLTQPNTPLDMNEFPALGGQPSANPAAAWNRLNTASPQNRGGPQQQQQHQQHQIQQDQLDAFPPPSNKDMFGAGMDEFRIGAGVGMGGGGGSQSQQQQQNQMPPSSMEEFPPLAARATPGAIGGMEGLGGQQQRQGMGSRLMPQMDGMIPQQQGVIQSGEADKKNLMKGNSSSMVSNGAPGLSNLSPSSVPQSMSPQAQQSQHVSPAPGLPRPSQQQHPQPQGPGQSSQKAPSTLNGDNFSEVRAEGAGLDDSPYGLTQFVRRLQNDGRNDPLASGQDLTHLGLNLNRPDGVLYANFSSPFVDLDTKPLEPKYYLPACYTVTNTQPIAARLACFSDDTLFYMFYTMPKDLMQELVSFELAQRNWRFHLLHQLWLTKDPRGHVEQLSDTSEKGFYLFFDPIQWEKVSKEIILDYTHLDPRTTGTFINTRGQSLGVGLRHGF